ncbi:TPA: hypothetical protein G8W61_004474 [Salmonella enterica]|uniref:Uncharacterized protein n=1 Tax=Salmonella enterica TaxID=28901 RepID=A0A759YIM5_SALER|nr:hypothetical protein [Salmonella enterica]
MTLEEIGRKYGITEGAVRKKARTKKWVRKKVRKSGTKTVKNVPQNRISKNAGKSSNGAGSDGTQKGTQIAQIQVRKVRKTKPIKMRSFQMLKPDVAGLTGWFSGTICANCELCDKVRIENCE